MEGSAREGSSCKTVVGMSTHVVLWVQRVLVLKHQCWCSGSIRSRDKLPRHCQHCNLGLVRRNLLLPFLCPVCHMISHRRRGYRVTSESKHGRKAKSMRPACGSFWINEALPIQSLNSLSMSNHANDVPPLERRGHLACSLGL